MKCYFGNNCTVDLAPYTDNISKLVEEKIALQEYEKRDDAFFIGDIGDVIKKYRRWQQLLPRVEPFYAVKCNQDHAVLKVLADLGASFDCASKAEIQQILDLGLPPSRIIYANPCKQTSFLRYAAKQHVRMMTFDNEHELHKIKTIFPDARLVLRILPITNCKAQCELGMKFGCHPSKAGQLLEKAKELQLNVIGISFHVGSGIEAAEAFAIAVEQAYEAFQLGCQLGFPMTLLDIGGGFPGQKTAPISMDEIADVLNVALDKYFPVNSGVRIIAEPGRYFVASAFTLGVNVIAKRVVSRDRIVDGSSDQCVTRNDQPSFMYYVNDGVYGSFNCLLYDHAKVTADTVKEFPDDLMVYPCSVWGPTCDGLDCILQECELPELEVGDWLYFEDMGAYTMCASSVFNGMPRPRMFYCCQEDLWRSMYPDHHKKTGCSIPAVKLQLRAGHSVNDVLDENEDKLPQASLMTDRFL